MRPKLEALITDNETFGVGAKSVETGAMVNEYDDVIDFVILEFDDRFEVYLNLYDNESIPKRNVLAKGIANSMDIAKELANENLHRLSYKNNLH